MHNNHESFPFDPKIIARNAHTCGLRSWDSSSKGKSLLLSLGGIGITSSSSTGATLWNPSKRGCPGACNRPSEEEELFLPTWSGNVQQLVQNIQDYIQESIRERLSTTAPLSRPEPATEAPSSMHQIHRTDIVFLACPRQHNLYNHDIPKRNRVYTIVVWGDNNKLEQLTITSHFSFITVCLITLVLQMQSKWYIQVFFLFFSFFLHGKGITIRSCHAPSFKNVVNFFFLLNQS